MRVGHQQSKKVDQVPTPNQPTPKQPTRSQPMRSQQPTIWRAGCSLAGTAAAAPAGSASSAHRPALHVGSLPLPMRLLRPELHEPEQPAPARCVAHRRQAAPMRDVPEDVRAARHREGAPVDTHSQLSDGPVQGLRRGLREEGGATVASEEVL